MPLDLQFFDQFIPNMGNASINLVEDDIRIMLTNGYTFQAIHDEYVDVESSEIEEGNGYIAGGKSITGVTFGWDVETSKNICTMDNVYFTAVEEDMAIATGAIIYSFTSSGKKLIAYVNFAEELQAIIGTDLVIAFNGDGVFTIEEA